MKDELLTYLKSKIGGLPHSPGVYQYYNKDGVVIYVGKAKDLKKRVSSYFNKVHEEGKTRILVKHIVDIVPIVVDTEEDALLLENNLIKKYQPRYNVLLKDDKTFPWIVVKNEAFPRVFQTRSFIKDGSTYFGPYTSLSMVRTLIDLFRDLYPLRTCSLNLKPEAILKGKYKVCLEFHMGRCKAPCVGLYNEEAYLHNVEAIKNILKGNVSSVTKYMKELMLDLASQMEFEKADEIKQQLKQLESYQSKSTVVNPKMQNVDVFSIVDDENSAFVNFLKVVNGSIIQSHTMEFKKRIEESQSDVLLLAITEMQSRTQMLAAEILVPFMPEFSFKQFSFTVPQIGDKKKLLDLSERNVKYYRLEQIKQQISHKKVSRDERVVAKIQSDLRLKESPVHIECFDNSNIQGTNPVAACVVFRNGKPFPKDYRHYNIKTVIGANDFASMQEIVYRRYKRLVDEGVSLPQLIVIDGGKGQLGAAVQALTELNLMGQIAVIGIAKRLEEIFFPGDPVPLYIDKNSESLKVIQHLRNEAHRFGITFHRLKRSSNFMGSELDAIPGIGPATVQQLFTHFKSLNNIKGATMENLQALIGLDKGSKVYSWFNTGNVS